MTKQEEFHRIKQLPPYVFEEVNTLKAKLRGAGRDIIDLGMGNPDMPTPSHIVDKLVETARNPKAHRYSVSRGIIGLRRAMARYYKRRFDVELSPETEIVATIGSKEGFANLAQAITGRCHSCAKPRLSDSRLRFHYRRRRHCGRSRAVAGGVSERRR